MKTCTFPRLFVIATCHVATVASAAVAITDPGNTPVVTDTSGSADNTMYGYNFVVGSKDLSVSALGLWDDKSDGFSSAHDVRLWYFDTSTGDVLLGTVTIPAGQSVALQNGFEYVELAVPVILGANKYYNIGVTGFGSSGDAFHNTVVGVGPTLSPDIASADSYYLTTLDGWPLVSVGGSPYVGPNFRYQTVPEPRTTALLWAFLVAVMARRIFRKICAVCGYS